MLTQSAGTVEYADCISAVGQDSPNECREYDTKRSDGEALLMLDLWGMQSTPLLPSIPDSLWPLGGSTWLNPIYGLSRTKHCTYAKLNCLK